MRSRLAAVVAALGLAVTGVAIAPGTARADVPCTITNFRPRTVVVGLSPHTSTFGLSTNDCSTLEHWSLEGEDFFVYTDAPQNTFNPYANSEAGPQDVIATADNADFEERQRVFANGFSLKRRTTWQSGTFNASPEPVRRGQVITIKGRLLVADWTNDRYVGYGGRGISVQYRTPTGTYTTIKTTTTASDGSVRTTVPAKATGVWRVVYSGNSLAGIAIAIGDSVQVTG